LENIVVRLAETHAHLDDQKFDADRDEVVQRSKDAGIEWMVTVGTDLESSRAAIALSERYPNVYATVGIHPHHATIVNQALLATLRALAVHPRVVAVGEIGLDFYRDFAPRKAQRAAFKAQLDLAADINKPVVVHIRDKSGESGAYDEVLATLYDWLAGHSTVQSPNLGVLHCFSGNLASAQSAIDLGFYVGIDGPITYPNAKALRAVVAELPLDRLLLETDCPYLAPQKRRGRRNEPAYLPYIARKVAEIKGVDVRRVAQVTTANAERLFHLTEK
jgi:TatD DNase family protein